MPDWNKKNNKLMVIVFIILILSFCIISVIFIYKNNFAPETLEILYPAVGAILLSLFIGIKLLYIDRRIVDNYDVPIAILFNKSTGEFTSMAGDHVTFQSESFYKLNGGIGLVDKMPNTIENFKFKEKFEENETIITSYLIQYAFWKWFRSNQTYSRILRGTNYVIGANNFKKSSGSASASEIEKLRLKRIALEVDHNPFLTKPILENPLDLELSQNFQIITEHDDFKFSLKNKASTFSMNFTNYYGEPLKKSPLVNKILEINGCEYNNDFIIAVIIVKFKFEQHPFFIFSDQAKYDRTWHSQIKSELIEAFSWQILRNIYDSTEIKEKNN